MDRPLMMAGTERKKKKAGRVDDDKQSLGRRTRISFRILLRFLYGVWARRDEGEGEGRKARNKGNARGMSYLFADFQVAGFCGS